QLKKKIARLEREIFTLPSEIGQAQADLDLAKLSRREDLEALEENSKNAIPEAVARHLNIAIEQAEQEIKAEIKVMKEKATTEKEKAIIETIEKAIDSRYSMKKAVTSKERWVFKHLRGARNGRVKKVKEVFDRPNMWLDTRILVEDGEDAYMAALIKGVDPKTLTVEERDTLKSSAQETLSALKPEDLARLKTMAKEKLINSFTRADGKLPSGMESYLLDTPDGQRMIDEAAAKHKEAFKGVKGKVSEYFRTMNRKKALKLLLFLFMPLVISAPLMAAGKYHPFSE
ncbi:hypothetical protein M1307_00355, partial [Patescibacteria group bacterium]|nr:hypothetical protein [Patescibacteria group bacterium]